MNEVDYDELDIEYNRVIEAIRSSTFNKGNLPFQYEEGFYDGFEAAWVLLKGRDSR